MTEPLTLIVNYDNGESKTFKGVTGFVETETKLKFKGKLAGDDVEREWTIMLSKVEDFAAAK